MGGDETLSCDTPLDVLRCWFEELTPQDWFEVRAENDRLLAERFGALHARATRAELCGWRRDAAGRLAEVLVLDQFSRNIHRGSAAAFAQDGMALCLAQEAVAAGLDRELPPPRRKFFYLPYMHSESPVVHRLAEPLFEALAREDPAEQGSLDYECRHRDILERFGRYPHRNAVLGRASTEQEQEFLRRPGSGF